MSPALGLTPSPCQPRALDYAEALDWLHAFADYERKPGGHVFSLDRPRRLLEMVGHPERAYRSVVVAGTKGKGSTAAMLQALLRAAGWTVGLYTQPHLHSYRERVRVGDDLIGEAELAAGVQRLAPVVESLHRSAPELGRLTTYELGTALALAHFAARGVDWAVLEVGLGGRLDAVNAVDSALAVITPISLDHTEVLGNSVDQIAREKAGIIHPGATVVCAPQPPEALLVVEQTCRERGAALRMVDSEALRGLELHRFPAATPLEVMRSAPFAQFSLAPDNLPVNLPLGGQHQAINTAVALAAASECGATLSVSQTQDALAQVRWPGRLEVLADRPTTVVDGAHNGASAACLAAAVRAHFEWRRLTLVVGASADKDLPAILAPLLPLADRVIATNARQPRALPAAEVAHQALAAGAPAEIMQVVADAVRAARQQADARDFVLITGSLFVVAEARESLGWAESRP